MKEMTHYERNEADYVTLGVFSMLFSLFGFVMSHFKWNNFLEGLGAIVLSILMGFLIPFLTWLIICSFRGFVKLVKEGNK